MQILSKPIVLIRICLFFGFSILMVGEKRDNVRQIDVVFQVFAVKNIIFVMKFWLFGPKLPCIIETTHLIRSR